MKKWIVAVVSVIFSLSAIAAVQIKNVSVVQLPGTKTMQITYDVSHTETNFVTVSLAISNGTQLISSPNLSGDVGGGILTGPEKMIIWDGEADWNNNVTGLSYTVTADDGYTAPCPVAKTGQLISYRSGDDGDLEPGTDWPDPRFTDNEDGTVTDRLTGLRWVKTPHSLPDNYYKRSWNQAIDFCNSLSFAGNTSWRLPSRKELMSLLDYQRNSPALQTGHPFSGIHYTDNMFAYDYYWTGTTRANETNRAWTVKMYTPIGPPPSQNMRVR